MCFCWLSACLGEGKEAALLLVISGREANPHRWRHGQSCAALAALPKEMQPWERPGVGWLSCSRSGRKCFPGQETPSLRGLLQPQALPHLPQGTEAFLATNNARMWHRHRGAARAAKSLCLLNPCSLHFGSEAFSKAQGTPVQGRACLSVACLPAGPAFVGFWPPNPECFVTTNPNRLGLKLC